jgi:UTP---glucose-1-phosphate uridylyltransferase
MKIKEKNLKEELSFLKRELVLERALEKKKELLLGCAATQSYLAEHPQFAKILPTFFLEEQNVLLSLCAIGQAEHIFSNFTLTKLRSLLTGLLPVENFYREIGGIVGYHITCLELLEQKEDLTTKGDYHAPSPRNLAEETPAVRRQTLQGISSLNALAEIYPLGGAADRLSLYNETTGSFQIAATLEFCEKALIQRLIEDLQAREYLYYQIFKKAISIPLILMTSEEKEGDMQVRHLFEAFRWFGRKKEDFFFFSQPLVPTMNRQGKWCTTGPSRLLYKPGGHGVIWKLAQEKGALKWLKEKGVRKALMRQINNLSAGVDYGILAFLGIGFGENKDFGFASCPRSKGLSEGVNLVIENEKGYCLTNIEYCDIEHFQIDEETSSLANTNLLLVDVETIEELLPKLPIPGMLVNCKAVKYKDSIGQIREEEILRLESTMQNLADALVEPEGIQRSYITTNKRLKTISTLKKEFAFGSSILQTPEQCYLDLLENARDLLVNYCQFEVPSVPTSTHFFEEGPSFIFLYHPALGPLYHIIGQKIRRGRLATGSELKLEIAEVDLEDLDVDGSLSITTDAVMGHKDKKGVLQYSERTGKCTLKNVKIRNRGVHFEASRCFWKDEIVHKERCEIQIGAGGEFYAENLLLEGDLKIKVPSRMKVTASLHEGKLTFSHEPLQTPSWNWEYRLDESVSAISLKKNYSKSKKVL